MPDAALRNIGKGGDAGMWMEPEAGKRIWFSLSIEEVKEYEGFQKMAKVRRRHQSRDRPVTLSKGASGDTGKRLCGGTVSVRGRVAVFSWDSRLDMGCPLSNFAGIERSIESRSCMLACFPYFNASISNLPALLNR